MNTLQSVVDFASQQKSKKYASPVPMAMQLAQGSISKQPLPQHSTTQPQFQINKAYNVVSILKTSTTNAQQSSHSHMTSQGGLKGQSHQQSQQQQSQHHQSYANVVNRPTISAGSQQQQQSTVICSGGNIMTVNNCQLNTGDLNSAAIYNLSGHRPPQLTGGSGGGGVGGIIDSNGRFVGSSEMSKAGVNTASCNVAVSNNSTQLSTGSSSSGNNAVSGSVSGNNQNNQQIIALTNSHGITVGTSSVPYTIHDKGLLGVNVNVVNGVNVSCIDNRKFDYKNNNLLSNSSFQANQEVNHNNNNK